MVHLKNLMSLRRVVSTLTLSTIFLGSLASTSFAMKRAHKEIETEKDKGDGIPSKRQALGSTVQNEEVEKETKRTPVLEEIEVEELNGGELDAFLKRIQENPELQVNRLSISLAGVQPGDIESEVWEAMGKWLFTQKEIKSLSLKYCALLGEDAPDGKEYEFLQDLGEWIEDHEHLKEFDFSGNHCLHSPGLKPIVKGVQRNKSLKVFKLDDISPQDLLWEQTLYAVLDNKNLSHFSFQHNQMGYAEMNDLTDYLRQEAPPLQIDLTDTTYPPAFAQQVDDLVKAHNEKSQSGQK